MYRYSLVLIALIVGQSGAAEPDKVELNGAVGVRGLPMAECDTDVQRIQLVFKFDKDGAGTGTLTLDATPNPVDEFGFPITIKSEPLLKLDCQIRLSKKKKVLAEVQPVAAGAQAVEVEWLLYEITGPKIVSQLSLAREANAGWSHARFIWATKDGKNRTAVDLRGPVPMEKLQVPCHPGCFPAGTRIQVLDGTKAVEDIRAGEQVATIGTDGRISSAKVASMFVTRNRLVEVTFEGQTLITTATQPLSLADGTLRAAGELKAGERIQVWRKGERHPVRVKAVDVTLRDAPVYNLVLGEPKLFVANGVLARSKPPAPAKIPMGP